jgi:hypothetical protein
MMDAKEVAVEQSHRVGCCPAASLSRRRNAEFNVSMVGSSAGGPCWSAIETKNALQWCKVVAADRRRFSRSDRVTPVALLRMICAEAE